MLIDVKQLCKELNVSRGTIFKLMREGMPKHRLSPRMLRFDKNEVLIWIQSKAS